MKGRGILLSLLLLSIVVDLTVLVFVGHIGQTVSWPLGDLGPAVMQDSYSVRSPALELPSGMLGDIPGGYPVYTGVPLYTPVLPCPGWPSASLGLPGLARPVDHTALLAAVLIAIVPVVVLVVLGRHSYGYSKTR